MQLSFSSLPLETAAPAGLNSAPKCGDESSDNSATASPAPSSGFAQLLAGLAPAKATAGAPNPRAAADVTALLATAGTAAATDPAPGGPATATLDPRGLPILPALGGGDSASGPTSPVQGKIGCGPNDLLGISTIAAGGVAASGVPDVSGKAGGPTGAKSPSVADSKDATESEEVQAYVLAAMGQGQPTALPLPVGVAPSPVGAGPTAAKTALSGSATSGLPVYVAARLCSPLNAAVSGRSVTGPAAAPGAAQPASGAPASEAAPSSSLSSAATLPATGAAAASAPEPALPTVVAEKSPVPATPTDAPATANVATTATTADTPSNSPLPTAIAAGHASDVQASSLGMANVATAPGQLEKFAVAGASLPAAPKGIEKPVGKSSLSTEAKEVAQYRRTIGISGAGSVAPMPAASMSPSSTTSESAPVAASAAATEARAQSDALPQPVALPSTAHRAVEAVLNVADRFSSRDQHSVNLQFSVGGSDLNVRVELRAGEVHTTFRTDSAELRAALSGEWHTMAAQNNGDRSVRLAAPVFTNQSGTSASGDQASSQQRGADSRGAGDNSSGWPGSRRFASATNTTSTAVAAPAPTTRSTSANSVHLHTLA